MPRTTRERSAPRAVFPLGFLKSVGIAALVIAPAIFAVWGRKLAVKPRGRTGGWYRLAHGVMRHPLPIALATGALMLVMALPALRAVWTPVDSSVIPKGQTARTVVDTVDRYFPGGQGDYPITIVTDPANAQRVVTRVQTLPGVNAPVALNATTAQIGVLAQGDPMGDTARQLVGATRGVAGGALVGGPAAAFVDQQAAIGDSLPLAVALLVGLTMLVLWLMTGSIVLPVKAIVMNALAVGAALVFALSTDYGVFLLGRIKEARDSGRGDREAVAVGLERRSSSPWRSAPSSRPRSRSSSRSASPPPRAC